MTHIDTLNEGALALREVLLSYRNVPATFMSPESLSKSAPFFGYVEVGITGVPSFLMFSNNDDFVAQRYFWLGADAYEPLSVQLWAGLATSSAGVVDVGSYSGLYSLVAAKRNKKTKVYAFEALDRVFARIKVNQSVNMVGNLSSFHLAISEGDGELELNVYSGDSILVSGSSLVEKGVQRGVFEKKRVATTSLDSLVASGKISRIDLLKIDAEGAEHQVLRGGLGVISQFKPDILCELLKGAEIAEMEQMLAPLGYRYVQIDDANGKLRELDSLAPAHGMHDLNTLFTQKSLSTLHEVLHSLGRTES